MNKIELAQRVTMVRTWLQELERVQVKCATCADYSGNQCAKYQVVPPAEVQQVGCEEWVSDGIPF
jgi:Ni,Fe-hydrogenase III large subunit